MADLTGGRVFLDAAGSAPMSTRSREAFLAGLDEGWADPDRVHSESRRARALLDGARESIGAVVGSRVEHTLLVPTFGLGFDRAIAGIAAGRRGMPRIVASAIERRPVLRIAERVSGSLSLVPVNEVGLVDPQAFTELVAGDDVALALVQHGNEEVGTVQRLEVFHDATTRAQVPLVVDATSTLGHVAPPVGWDAVVGDAADWGGPRGIALLALRPSTRCLPVPPMVVGKVSVPAALAAAVALEEREEHRAEVGPRLARLTAQLRAGLAGIRGIVVFGEPEIALPHILTFTCTGVDGEVIASELDRAGFAVGSGSACTTEPSPESHVLAALGTVTLGNVRLALHPGITTEDVEMFITKLTRIVGRLRD